MTPFKTARFVASASSLEACPPSNRIEIAIAGRSNAGKSSLINALTGVAGLARTSKTPGRTRALNFFAIGERLALVDLPGFGYAKMPRAEAARLGAMITSYIERRRNLAAVVIVIDARRGPEAEELVIAQAARHRGAETLVAAAKCDKLRQSERAAAARTFAALAVQPIWCSAVDGEGIVQLRRELLGFADRMNFASSNRVEWAPGTERGHS